jgi:DNA-binding transcriptional MocR family regulator
MSHAATNWAIQQRGLKPAAKIVLWHLCDRFNPDYGCFPSQARLAEDCEISRATLNRHLDDLEAAGLIRRLRMTSTPAPASSGPPATCSASSRVSPQGPGGEGDGQPDLRSSAGRSPVSGFETRAGRRFCVR